MALGHLGCIKVELQLHLMHLLGALDPRLDSLHYHLLLALGGGVGALRGTTRWDFGVGYPRACQPTVSGACRHATMLQCGLGCMAAWSHSVMVGRAC